MPRKYRSKAVKRALKARGGFVTPTQFRAGLRGLAGSAYKAGTTAAMGKVIDMVRDYDVPDVFRVAKDKVVGRLEGLAENVVFNSQKTGHSLGFSEVNRSRARAVGDRSNLGKTYKTVFTAGRPNTRSVKDLMRTQGEVTVTGEDTVYGPNYRSTDSDRVALSQNSGFNQKKIINFKDWQWSHDDMKTAMGIVDYPIPDFSLQQSYLTTTKLTHHMRVMNTGSYFPAWVRISAWIAKNPSLSEERPMESLVPSAAQAAAGTTDLGILPNYYWQEGIQESDNVEHCNVDPSAQFTTSPLWDKRYKLARSFTKKLKPGDTWNFTGVQTTGPGLEWGLFQRVDDAQTTAPVGLTYLVEQWGVPCEAAWLPNGDRSWIGTSPTYMQYEFKKRVSYVPSLLDSNLNPSSSGGGMQSGIVHIRSFIKSKAIGVTTKPAKPFFATEYIKVKGAAQPGCYIPVLTDLEVKYAGEADAKDSDEAT